MSNENGIYAEWIGKAYDQQGKLIKKTWDAYIPLEQAIYEDMLATKNNVVKGTVSEIAKKHSMTIEYAVGFLDGISEVLQPSLDLENITEETMVDAKFDFEALYKKMVELGADHLAALPQWNNVLDEERQKQLYKEQKTSGTIVLSEQEKIGRNDPCHCGSGKKHKQCCL